MEETLTDQNCNQVTGGFSLSYFVELTGIYGIHPDFNYNNHEYFEAIYDDGFVTVAIGYTELILELVRKIDLLGNEIENLLMDSIPTRKRRGVALDILSNQVFFAEKYGFALLKTLAYRNAEKPDEKWTGYWVWGKYGFLMLPPYREAFLDLIQSHIREGVLDLSKKRILLHDLLLNADGFKWWQTYGFQWQVFLQLGLVQLAEKFYPPLYFGEAKNNKKRPRCSVLYS